MACLASQGQLSAEAMAPVDPDALIVSVLDQLPSESAVWVGLRMAFRVEMRVTVFINAWSRGFELQQATLARIALVHANLGIEMYCNGEERDV